MRGKVAKQMRRAARAALHPDSPERALVLRDGQPAMRVLDYVDHLATFRARITGKTADVTRQRVEYRRGTHYNHPASVRGLYRQMKKEYRNA